MPTISLLLNELAVPHHLITSSAVASGVGGTVSPSMKLCIDEAVKGPDQQSRANLFMGLPD